MYRCVSTSISGFIQQLAVGYVAHGYWFYVTGTIPEHKDPQKTDAKIIRQYDCAVSKWTRFRRQAAGSAKIQYLRFRHFFVILATPGEHRFFAEESSRLRDIRETPIKFASYAIGCREWKGRWRPSVRIERDRYRELVDCFLKSTWELPAAELWSKLHSLPYEPYAPVRDQLLRLLRAVNRKRTTSGLEELAIGALRLRRRPVLPFGEAPGEHGLSATSLPGVAADDRAKY
jgi:hypothetical protein